MPGIVGLITKKPREWAEPQLLRMVESIRHEAFYGTGTWIDESLGVYVGWAIRKNSFSDGMPLHNEQANVTLVFSGEEYPDPATKSRLSESGHEFDAKGPSYLVHLYEEDKSFPANLNGRFHGLLADRRRGTAVLFNDRYGMNRVYYHEAGEAFYFGAEAKAILAVRPELRSLNTQSLGEFVGCGCVMENRTLFQDVHALPPGSAWSFRDGSLEKKGSYFQASEWENQERFEPEPFYRELRDVFARVLPRYFNGRESIGMSLTGGLDTRMIMAWHKAPEGSLPCYSFGGPYRDCEDVQLAREVAVKCGQPHRVIPVGKQFLSRFGELAERSIYLTDGCVEVNRASDLYANQQAREIAPVRMTGNYGSEVLRWVPAFGPRKSLGGFFSRDFLSSIDAASKTYASVATGHPVSFAVFRQAPWHHYGLLALEQTQLSLRTPYLDNDLVRTVFRAPSPAIAKRNAGNKDISLRLIAEGDAALGRLRTDRGITGNHESLSAALTREFLEFTFKAEYAYDYGMPQWMAKVDHVFSPLHLERLFLGRHKFAHYRVWYRDDLAGYVRETLLDPRALARPYVEKKQVESIVEGHTKGDRNYTTAIHSLLTLELIHRCFIDAQ